MRKRANAFDGYPLVILAFGGEEVEEQQMAKRKRRHRFRSIAAQTGKTRLPQLAYTPTEAGPSHARVKKSVNAQPETKPEKAASARSDGTVWPPGNSR